MYTQTDRHGGTMPTNITLTNSKKHAITDQNSLNQTGQVVRSYQSLNLHDESNTIQLKH